MFPCVVCEQFFHYCFLVSGKLWVVRPSRRGGVTQGCFEQRNSLVHACVHQRGPYCPYLLSSETTAKGTGLEKLAGKEDPVELDSSLAL